MKVNLSIDAERIESMKILDMDADSSRPYTSSDMAGNDCVKCDGDYYLIKDNSTLTETLKDENIISEAEALGLRGIMEKYIAPHFNVSVR